MPDQSQVNLLPQGENLAQYLTRIRNLRKLSKAELARRASVHFTTISRLEGGEVAGIKVKRKVQERIAAALGLPVDYLKAASSGTALESVQSNKICSICWIPSKSPEVRWSDVDANFCFRCGHQLQSSCLCGEEILIKGKFCPHCGKAYQTLNKQNHA